MTSRPEISARRLASYAAGAFAFAVAAAWVALTWDAWLTNFQVRWMCDEDRPFALQRRTGVESLALPDEVLRRDPRALQAYGEAYPLVAGAATPEGRRAGHALLEVWPRRIRSYWGYGVLRTELAIVERGESRRVLASMMLFRRIEREGAALADLRRRLAPPAESCQPSDRIEFVKQVLRPAG